MVGSNGNFFRDNDDLLFQFRHGVRWEELAPLAEANFSDPDGPRDLEEAVSFYEGAVDAIGAFAAREVAPRERLFDTEEPRLVDGEVVFPEPLAEVFRGMSELGFHGLSIPRALGGMNGPLALSFLAEELLARADVSAMTHFAFHAGVANALQVMASIEGNLEMDQGRFVRCRYDEPIRSVARGESFGCMVLTESDAGSDLAAISTRAVERDGGWRLTGEKIFITLGHGQWHFVLARSEGPERPGLDGLSLFLAPRMIDRGGARVANVTIAKLEKKLGQHGSATCSLVYDDSEAELVGERGRGFKAMLTLMNAARISVGVEAIGVSESALRMASAYAADRRSMGRPIARHELIAEKLDGATLWIQALRALAVEAVNAMEIATRGEMLLKASPPARSEDRQRLVARQRQMARRARRLTPLVKYLGAEQAVAIARDAMQIYGGAGYIDEPGIHKKLRDALVFPVYEGTSQIQALMVTKDHLLGAARDPAGFLRKLARARITARRAESPRWAEVNRARALALGATETILLRIVGAKVRSELRGGLRHLAPIDLGRFLAKDFLRRWDMRTDFAPGLLHAERLTRILGDIAIAKILVRQAERFPERGALADRFLHRMSLRVEAEARTIERDDGAVLEALAVEEEGDVPRDPLPSHRPDRATLPRRSGGGRSPA